MTLNLRLYCFRASLRACDALSHSSLKFGHKVKLYQIIMVQRTSQCYKLKHIPDCIFAANTKNMICGPFLKLTNKMYIAQLQSSVKGRQGRNGCIQPTGMATSFVIEGSLSFLRTWLHFKSSIELSQCIPHLDIQSLCNHKEIKTCQKLKTMPGLVKNPKHRSETLPPVHFRDLTQPHVYPYIFTANC